MYLLYTILLLSSSTGSVLCLLPQVSQEGLLRPYRSYADVVLFHYYVPKESNLATFEFAAFMSGPSCPRRDVHVYLQHGSYPVMSADNAIFPPLMYTNRTSMYNITLKSSYQPHNASILKVYYPLPGSWFAAGFLPNWDISIQQEGLGHKCQYSLGSIAMWTQVANIASLPLHTTTRIRSMDHYSYYRFYVPTGTWEFTVTVDGCRFLSSRRHSAQPIDSRDPSNSSFSTERSTATSSFSVKNSSNDTEVINPALCIQNVFLRARGLPDYAPNNLISTSITEELDSAYTHVEQLPFTDDYYYLLIVSDVKVAHNITISVKECPIQMLGKSFIQKFAGFGITSTLGMKDQAVRMNMTVGSLGVDLSSACKCSSIFRLTRVKHPQDFSDTFLLESRDWFTSWLALTDSAPVGVTLEILPYVDIGGTLSIGLHLDDLLINATTQTVSVVGCIRKSQPPDTFCCSSGNISDCCESGLTLHISSTSFSSLDAVVLIPYPEPDTWFISFTTVCSFEGVVMPCAVEEALVNLDIRTQPCVFTKPQSPGGPILPCGKYGICQEVHKGQFFYTTCRCLGGYRGWACSDDTEATSETLLLLTTMLLTISNAFFVPAIFLACRRRMFTHAMVYMCTMISSTLYHACDQDIYGWCLTRYQVLQFCDFFCSILAFWVTLIALAKAPPMYDSTLYMLGAIVIAVGVEYNRTGLMVFIVPFALGVGIPVTVWTYRSVKSRVFIRPEMSSILLFLPGILLGAAGLILFAFVETEENYRYTHSAWHVIIACSLLYLLPKTLRRASSKNGSGDAHMNGQLEVSNSAELASVTDPNTSTPDQTPVFFITSELDHLVQDLSGPPR